MKPSFNKTVENCVKTASRQVALVQDINDVDMKKKIRRIKAHKLNIILTKCH